MRCQAMLKHRTPEYGGDWNVDEKLREVFEIFFRLFKFFGF
jgi:hypothetical protein